MNPRNPPQLAFDEVVVETLTGCLINVPSPTPAAAFPLCAAGKPSGYIPAYMSADVFEGSSNTGVRPSPLPDTVPDESALLARRRRRNHDDPTEQPSPAALDIISRFQMIIGAVESAGTSRPRPEIGELLKAVQRLKLATGEMRQRQQKRPRCPAGSLLPDVSAASGGRSSVLVLQETIAAIEQMRLSEPMERSEEYAHVLNKLEELLRTEEEGG